MKPHRPNLMGTSHTVVSGHYLASLAGSQVLEAGGNAFDAGVAVGLATNVVESEMTGFAGVAPSMLYLAPEGRILSLVGVGPWPAALSTDYFWTHHDGRIPAGILNTVVPAAPAIWLTVLERFGTMSFADVAQHAIRLARDGFVMYPLMSEVLKEHLPEYAHLAETARIFAPGGRVPEPGERFIQSDLARTLQFLSDEEAAAGGTRENGIRAARRAFYEGDLAAAIADQQVREGGLMTREDLARFTVEQEDPARASFRDWQLYGCGPWSQGPMVLLAAQLLDGLDLEAMGHNEARYIHAVTEALKLAAADREHYFGDPAQIDVPLHILLSREYADQRRALIVPDRAAPGMPAPGALAGYPREPWKPDPSAGPGPDPAASPEALAGLAPNALETSYFAVVDAAGNVFSATPSDPTISGAVVPGTGITTSMWGSRGHTDPDHPARVGPGWRPRMSANPMLAVKPGAALVPLGSPGSEVLGQAQLQVLMNLIVFRMDPQSAVEAARFASYSWPASALPHTYAPGRLNLESNIDREVARTLGRMGHDVKRWPEREWRAGSVCAIHCDLRSGVRTAGADPRRTAYAIGR